jgi:GntR family transcriptional regulator
MLHKAGRPVVRQQYNRVNSEPDVVPLKRQSLRQMAEEQLKELIRRGRFPEGERLPTEPVLADKFGISRSTLREALAALAQEGMVNRSPAGTIVVGAGRVEQGLDRLVSFERLAEQQGRTCTSELLELQQIAADAEVAAHLQLAPGDAVISVVERKLLDGRPGGLLEQYVSPLLVSMATLQRRYGGSLLEFLFTLSKPRLAFARATVRAVLVPDIGERLGIAPTEPLLRLDQTTYTESERILSYARLFFRDEALQFSVTRRRLA